MKPSPTMEPTSVSSPGLDPQFSMMESEPRVHEKGQCSTHQKPRITQPYRRTGRAWHDTSEEPCCVHRAHESS